MNFRVSIVGHSYVRDLSHFGINHFNLSGVTFHLNFRSVPGATFSSLSGNHSFFGNLKSDDPDFVIVILGGNDLKANTELTQIYLDCENFFKSLRASLPNSCIIAAQIENRFYKPDNRFGSPPSKTFDFLRRHFNRHLRNKPYKDFILQVQGPGRLDNRNHYRDSVHLNRAGLSKYMNLIEGNLAYVYKKKFLSDS